MGKVDCVVEALEEKFNGGLSKGKKDKSIDIAENLLKIGKMSIQDISKATELPISKIEELQKNI